MEAGEYRTLFEAEDGYWWFRGLRPILADALRAAGLAPQGRLLDAGCGTGLTLRELERALDVRAFGFDLSPHAAPYWPRRSLRRACRASINRMPFPDASFDGAVCVDVLECDEVDPEAAYGELWRVVRPGGAIAVVVPAFAWLKTEGHHRAVHASRRYSRSVFASLLGTRPARVLRLTYVYALPFPPIAAARIALRCLAGRPAAARSELRPLPAPLNAALTALMRAERALLRATDMPVGSSLLAVVRREAAP